MTRNADEVTYNNVNNGKNRIERQMKNDLRVE
jgi:hypothetical protein